MITRIPNHVELALGRLREQYKRSTLLQSLITALVNPLQDLEDGGVGLRAARSLNGAEGQQLDDLGDLLALPRNGLSDDLYRITLKAKVAQNVSNGTGEDVITVYKLLMQARYVQLVPAYPAGIGLTAVGAQQIGSIDDIKAAVTSAALGGVSINLFAATNQIPFCFSGDTDPQGQGFMDLNQPATGGYLTTIV